MIPGIRLALEKQVDVRVIPTSQAIKECLDMAHEISIVWSISRPATAPSLSAPQYLHKRALRLQI
jgi:hypothetical protein